LGDKKKGWTKSTDNRTKNNSCLLLEEKRMESKENSHIFLKQPIGSKLPKNAMELNRDWRRLTSLQSKYLYFLF
jgi:hypothetical protein